MKTFGLDSYITWISLADTVLGWDNVITFWWIMFKSLCIFFYFSISHYSTLFISRALKMKADELIAEAKDVIRQSILPCLEFYPLTDPLPSPHSYPHTASAFTKLLFLRRSPVMMQLMKLHCPLPTIDEDDVPSWHRHRPRLKTPPPSRQCDTGYQIKQRIIPS